MNNQNDLPSLVIVGNGMVAGRFVDELLERKGQKYAITVIGAEPYGSYNRIMLSSVLAKDATIPSIVQKDALWYQAHNIHFISDNPVISVDQETKQVQTKDGQMIDYDQLVLATGSRAATIPAKNLDLDNIFSFRTIADTKAMMNIASNAKSALVVGGGLLGLEAAYGLAKFGIQVTLVHRSKWLLNRQLNQDAASMLKNVMSNMNIQFKLSDEVDHFNGNDQGAVSKVTFKSGDTMNIDMAVIATGITPNAQLGWDAGLKGQRAIEVDDYMATSDPHISAIGECIEHDGCTFGLVDPLWRQAESLAARLVEEKHIPFENQAIATKLKVSGVHVFSAGNIMAEEGDHTLVIRDAKANIYRQLLLKDNKIKGIILFGDVRSGQYYFELMQKQTDIGHLRSMLLFGEAYLPKDSSESIAA